MTGLRAPLLVIVVAFVAGGCLGSQLSPCGDQFCPPGKVCHAPSGSCYGSDQLTACDGIADATECRIADLVGFCRDGICLAPRCGDGIVYEAGNEQCDEGEGNSSAENATCREDCLLGRCGDGIVDADRGEVCDDGNAEPGDACAPGCGSDNTCGNGIPDGGEECDDGNSFTHDGCSACLTEQLTIQPIRTSGPRPRIAGAMAHDVARQRVVVFGGAAPTAGLRNDTWEWDGVRWREIKPVTSPVARSGAAAVYDVARHRIVLFGGDDGTTLRSDLWEYDGARWVERGSAMQPPGRTAHAMTYDAARKRVVVFGGRGGAGRLSDTWEWDGTQWTPAAVFTAGPPPMDEVAMAYDPERNQIVLFGGQTDTNVFSNRTWIYAAGAWTEATPAATAVPPARSSHHAVFDVARGRVAVFQGRGSSNVRDLWEWDGAGWQQTATNIPGFYLYGAAAYDVARRQVVYLYYSSMFVRAPAGTFTFQGAPQSPPARMQSSAAFDARRGRFVIYGGEGPSGPVANDIWEWDGTRWSSVPEAAINPGVRRSLPTVFDPAHGIVTAGSDRDLTTEADLWSWNGTAWTQLAGPSPLLSLRRSHGMVYDAARGRYVVYGGNFGQVDTVEWTGTAWEQVVETSPIGYRHNFAMAYDPLRNRTLIVGGGSSVDNFSTFEYDGTAWTMVASPPVFARGSAMVFDPYRKKLIWLADPEDIGLEVWEWAGAPWSKRKVEPTPAALYRPATAFDPIRREIVMFGGRASGTIINTTTVIAYQPNAAREACTSSDIDYDGDGLKGCADPDCAARCTPLCVDVASCPMTAPRCGDGICDPLEDCLLCPDCTTGCPADVCGDARCSGTETPNTCAGDCS